MNERFSLARFLEIESDAPSLADIHTGKTEILEEEEKEALKIQIKEGEDVLLETDKDNIVIGRLETCDLVLEGDTLISREHAIITREEDGYYLEDKSSTGVYIPTFEEDELKVKKVGEDIPNPVKLQNGNVLRFGERIVTFNICDQGDE